MGISNLSWSKKDKVKRGEEIFNLTALLWKGILGFYYQVFNFRTTFSI